MLPDEKLPKVAYKYICEYCDYSTSKTSSIKKHMLTDKHNILKNPNINVAKIDKFICNCGKTYKHSSTLYAHRKDCKPKEELTEPIDIKSIDKEMVMEILKQNDDLKNLLVEQTNKILELCKNGINNTNNTNCNNTNKTFNLQFFLNEQCKDAMNMVDFVNSIKLTLQDAENVGRLGYVRGMSNIIIDNLKALDIYKRPIHCTDSKRDVLYVKDENKWEKETEEFITIRRLIKSVTNLNGRNISLFKKKHPCCGTSESIYSDQFSKMYIEGFGGAGTDRDNENKIIKRLAREITIDKLS
jgi:hypothetical protein